MDDHDRRHVAVLEDRLDRIIEVLDRILDRVCMIQIDLNDLNTPPETGDPPTTDAGDGRMH
jgi:hypothetical protein